MGTPPMPGEAEWERSLRLFILPRLDGMDRAIGAHATKTDVAAIARDIDSLQKRLAAVADAQLDPDRVSSLVGQALEKNSARGWTSRERWMGVILFALTLATFALSAASRF